MVCHGFFLLWRKPKFKLLKAQQSTMNTCPLLVMRVSPRHQHCSCLAIAHRPLRRTGHMEYSPCPVLARWDWVVNFWHANWDVVWYTTRTQPGVSYFLFPYCTLWIIVFGYTKSNLLLPNFPQKTTTKSSQRLVSPIWDRTDIGTPKHAVLTWTVFWRTWPTHPKEPLLSCTHALTIQPDVIPPPNNGPKLPMWLRSKSSSHSSIPHTKDLPAVIPFVMHSLYATLSIADSNCSARNRMRRTSVCIANVLAIWWLCKRMQLPLPPFCHNWPLLCVRCTPIHQPLAAGLLVRFLIVPICARNGTNASKLCRHGLSGCGKRCAMSWRNWRLPALGNILPHKLECSRTLDLMVRNFCLIINNKRSKSINWKQKLRETA